MTNRKCTAKAPPRDVRKGCAFPVTPDLLIEALPRRILRRSREEKTGSSTGKPEAFRTSGGKAEE